jgi:ATP-dependent Lon protease
LRGKVLPIGGLREKSLAALRSGISRIIVPRASMKDVEEVPKELRRKLTFVPVADMREVLAEALTEQPAWRNRPVRTRRPSSVPAPASCRED